MSNKVEDDDGHLRLSSELCTRGVSYAYTHTHTPTNRLTLAHAHTNIRERKRKREWGRKKSEGLTACYPQLPLGMGLSEAKWVVVGRGGYE